MNRVNFLVYTTLFCGLLSNIGCTKNAQSNKIDEIMNADKGFQFPAEFPPDPGEAGKKTLEGIDSDHDGLRDDLQRWIYARFPNDPKKRAALKQMGIFYQKSLFLQNSPEDKKKNLQRISKASICLHENFPNGIVDPTVESEYLRAKALNTLERTKRYLEVDSWFNGMTSGPSYQNDGTACEN